MSGSVFVWDRVLLGVGFAAARDQLGRVAGDGILLTASEYAYGTGVTGLADAAGITIAAPRLAGVRSGDLADWGDWARLWLRWEAIGPDGELFPAMDADLTFSLAEGDTTVLTLAGVYRLPDQLGAGLDPAVVRCFATVTVRSFIGRLACALMHPAGAALR